MTPDGVDVQFLQQQLESDRVAFSDPALAADQRHQSGLVEALADRPNMGVVVVDVPARLPSDYRDLAQELSDASGLDTVLVRGRGVTSVVGEGYSRAQIESAQAGLGAVRNDVEAVEIFFRLVEEQGPNWAILAVLASILLVVSIAATATTTRRNVKY